MEKLEKKSFKLEALNKYGTDLTKMAVEDKLDPVIGRQHHMERVIQILCKRRKNSVCVIGDPGVDKTVIAEGLALRITNASPRKTQIFAIEMGRLVAGASNRGEFEERLTKVVDEVTESKGEIILFIDELHTLVGTGSGGHALDAANILKPALARGQLKCIGATTLEEYKKYIEGDSALKRRFQVVDVPEPSVNDTIEILKGVGNRYQDHHDVIYLDKALAACVNLSKQFMSGFLPDKAIDLMDEAGARVILYRSAVEENVKPTVTEEDIEQVVASCTGIPVEKVRAEESKRLLNMEKVFQKKMIGQDEAVEAVSRAIRRARVGRRDPSRPIASFIFTGLTGVGKTEMAKLLAQEYFGSRDSIVRFDMSEYTEEHTVSKLFGSPPGYIGHESGGQLTEAIRRKPHSVVLFDEIEKANSQVFNSLLQVLDDGRMTDGRGQTVDFKHTIMIMTSNIGSHLISWDSEEKVGIELKKFFTPEFLNRLDDIIIFKKLGGANLMKILDLILQEVKNRIRDKKSVVIEFRKNFQLKLVLESNCRRYGARPLRRAIRIHVEDTLAESILSGKLKEGDYVFMDADENGVVVMNHC